jgi:acyl carrier protein
MQLHEHIRSIIAEEGYIKADLITDGAKLYDDLGVDSLARIQIWTRIGTELALEVPDPDSEFWTKNSDDCLTNIVAIVERMKVATISVPSEAVCSPLDF